jgi:hypothetical protein
VKSLKAPLPENVGHLEVLNIRKAIVPGKNFPGEGTYLLPVKYDPESQIFLLAGLPRSPGVEAATPERLSIYPWTPELQKQLQTLGIEP